MTTNRSTFPPLLSSNMCQSWKNYRHCRHRGNDSYYYGRRTRRWKRLNSIMMMAHRLTSLLLYGMTLLLLALSTPTRRKQDVLVSAQVGADTPENDVSTWAEIRVTTGFTLITVTTFLAIYEFGRRHPSVMEVFDRRRASNPHRTPPPLMKRRRNMCEWIFLNTSPAYIEYSQKIQHKLKRKQKRQEKKQAQRAIKRALRDRFQRQKQIPQYRRHHLNSAGSSTGGGRHRSSSRSKTTKKILTQEDRERIIAEEDPPAPTGATSSSSPSKRSRRRKAAAAAAAAAASASSSAVNGGSNVASTTDPSTVAAAAAIMESLQADGVNNNNKTTKPLTLPSGSATSSPYVSAANSVASSTDNNNNNNATKLVRGDSILLSLSSSSSSSSSKDDSKFSLSSNSSDLSSDDDDSDGNSDNSSLSSNGSGGSPLRRRRQDDLEWGGGGSAGGDGHMVSHHHPPTHRRGHHHHGSSGGATHKSNVLRQNTNMTNTTGTGSRHYFTGESGGGSSTGGSHYNHVGVNGGSNALLPPPPPPVPVVTVNQYQIPMSLAEQVITGDVPPSQMELLEEEVYELYRKQQLRHLAAKRIQRGFRKATNRAHYAATGHHTHTHSSTTPTSAKSPVSDSKHGTMETGSSHGAARRASVAIRTSLMGGGSKNNNKKQPLTPNAAVSPTSSSSHHSTTSSGSGNNKQRRSSSHGKGTNKYQQFHQDKDTGRTVTHRTTSIDEYDYDNATTRKPKHFKRSPPRPSGHPRRSVSSGSGTSQGGAASTTSDGEESIFTTTMPQQRGSTSTDQAQAPLPGGEEGRLLPPPSSGNSNGDGGGGGTGFWSTAKARTNTIFRPSSDASGTSGGSVTSSEKNSLLHGKKQTDANATTSSSKKKRGPSRRRIMHHLTSAEQVNKRPLDIRDQELLRCVGLDTFVMLRFLRFGLDITWYPFVLGCFILMPTYYTNDFEGTVDTPTDGYFRITMQRLEHNSPRHWVCIVFAMAFYIFILRRLWIEWETFIALRMDFLANGDIEGFGGAGPINVHTNGANINTTTKKEQKALQLHQYRTCCMVESVPEAYRRDQELYEFFDSLFPGQVERAEMLLNASHLSKLIKQRKRNIVAYENTYAKHFHHREVYRKKMEQQGKKNISILKYICCGICSGRPPTKPIEPKVNVKRTYEELNRSKWKWIREQISSLCGKRTVKALPHYLSEIKRLNQEIDKEHKRIHQEKLKSDAKKENPNSGTFLVSNLQAGAMMLVSGGTISNLNSDTGFVQFKSLTAKQCALQCNIVGTDNYMVTTSAPEPRDVVWDNAIIERRVIGVRRLQLDIFFLTGTLFWSAVISGINLFSDFSFLSKIFPPWMIPDEPDSFMAGLISGYLPILILEGIMIALLIVLNFVSRNYIHFKTSSDVDQFVFRWHFGYRLANLCIIIISGSIFTTLDAVRTNPQAVIENLARGIARQSQFFLNNVIVSAGSEQTWELAQMPRMILHFLLHKIITVEAKSQRYLEKLEEAEQFNFGEIIPQFLFVFMISVVYTIQVPIIPGACAFFFYVAKKVYTHQALFVYAQAYEGGGKLMYRLNRTILVTLYVGIVVFFTLLGLKGMPIASPLFLFTMFPATLYVDHKINRTFVVPSDTLALTKARAIDETNRRKQMKREKRSMKRDNKDRFSQQQEAYLMEHEPGQQQQQQQQSQQPGNVGGTNGFGGASTATTGHSGLLRTAAANLFRTSRTAVDGAGGTATSAPMVADTPGGRTASTKAVSSSSSVATPIPPSSSGGAPLSTNLLSPPPAAPAAAVDNDNDTFIGDPLRNASTQFHVVREETAQVIKERLRRKLERESGGANGGASKFGKTSLHLIFDGGNGGDEDDEGGRGQDFFLYRQPDLNKSTWETKPRPYRDNEDDN